MNKSSAVAEMATQCCTTQMVQKVG